MTSVSLCGGGNCPKLLLATFSLQVPLSFEPCWAKAGSASSAAAKEITRSFRFMNNLLRPYTCVRGRLFQQPAAAGIIHPVRDGGFRRRGAGGECPACGAEAR